ncbi:tetratricopeptide repeat protein [Williamsia sp.]|uniref:tetratricopeptide repeat protein n=1 Tax=Williamsia sp. TaxID=1872085 RepID=UPI001A36291B|nr:tetratricopeptide repeat protein [Williamsia sp.]MBJ7291700.1 tetratricopeptide repeat protein [Williamsia sp.]
MITISALGTSEFAFPVVKTLLRELGVGPGDAHEPAVARGLRILFPLDGTLASSVRGAATSLTDAATTDSQIRFFQHHRALRSFVGTARWVADVHGPISVRVVDGATLADSDRAFLDAAVRSAAWRVAIEFDSDTTAVVPGDDGDQLRVSALLGQSTTAACDDLVRAAFEFVNAGDAWSAVAIGSRLMQVEKSPRVWNLMALGNAMLDRTLDAEFYYRRWADDGSALDRVRALYGLSMLYARHHPVGLRSMPESGRLLDEAYSVLGTLDTATRNDQAVRFDEVFNRNGHALVLFREGRVDEAIELLEWGITELASTDEKIAMHRSVLVYNLAQCHVRRGDLAAAIATYDRLLEVDPHMPEYHLEYARCLCAADDLDGAIAQCRIALDIDDTLATGWSLLGVYLGRQGRHGEAAAAHRGAHTNTPDSPGPQLDATYAWLRHGDVAAAAEVLSSMAPPADHKQRDRWALLHAEVLVREGRDSDALAVIDDALRVHPGSPALLGNRVALAGRG